MPEKKKKTAKSKKEIDKDAIMKDERFSSVLQDPVRFLWRKMTTIEIQVCEGKKDGDQKRSTLSATSKAYFLLFL